MPTLQGQVHIWRFGKHVRRFASVVIPFKEAVALFQPEVFDAKKRKGEQRKRSESHVRSLRREIEEGRFTPTPWSCTLPKPMQNKVVYGESDSTFTLEVPAKRTLPCTDGGHRREALEKILAGLLEKRKAAPDEATQDYLDSLIRHVESLPVRVEVMLDGDSRVDFLNLNKGKAVPKTLVFSMEVAAEQYDDPNYPRAAALARLLDEDAASPFRGVLKHDDTCPLKDPIPVSTLCAGRSGDLATSLIGLVRVGVAFGVTDKVLCRTVCAAYAALRKSDKGILDYGYPLTPPAHGGKLGASTMLVGVGMVLAYAMGEAELTIPSEEMLSRLVDAAEYAMGEKTNGDLGVARKRVLMRGFVCDFFRDSGLWKYEGVPVGLCRVLSAGAFGLKKMPKSFEEDSPAPAEKPDPEDVDQALAFIGASA